jgi:ribosomal protein S12 methylthiotransferase accessory factor
VFAKGSPFSETNAYSLRDPAISDGFASGVCPAVREMLEAMEIRFPGGLEVEALSDGFSIRTDQPVSDGGAGAAPSPFDLFLASIGTCAGIYALRFCQQRNLETEGLSLELTTEKGEDGPRVARVSIEVRLPPAFPARYRDAILRAVDQCKVKRHILEPPEFVVTVVASREIPAVGATRPLPEAAPAPSISELYQ